ncbi:MAG: hypothetical protein IJ608_02530 [Lachnospiraceae bacterium]|nr:hypothetical protein [Lachnospiraceae bacterium]
MPKGDGKNKQEAFKQALLGKKVPLLTLDNKWYKLLNEVGREEMKPIEEELNALLKKQGKYNTETKEIKKLKVKLMNDIVEMAGELESTGDKSLEKKIEDNKRILNECNEKLEKYEDENLELPGEIDRTNHELMVRTMANCYDTMQENTEKIEALNKWVADIRIELKKNLVRKQEMEAQNHNIYSYMHDIFGAEVVNLFDLTYNPEEQHPRTSKEKNSDKDNKDKKE